MAWPITSSFLSRRCVVYNFQSSFSIYFRSPGGRRHTRKGGQEFQPLSLYYSRHAIGKSEKPLNFLTRSRPRKDDCAGIIQNGHRPLSKPQTTGYQITKVSKLPSFTHVYIFDD